ncbi:MAG: hypothetical protein F6K08_27930 [Okeania sp. SIO1H6]|nr:hypothetical protein [Okeania sp. SIO1H6]
MQLQSFSYGNVIHQFEKRCQITPTNIRCKLHQRTERVYPTIARRRS